MTPDEMAGRLIVLETFAMTALALVLGNVTDDPGYKRASVMLDHLKESITGLAADQAPKVQDAARRYAREMIALVVMNLSNARPPNGPLN